MPVLKRGILQDVDVFSPEAVAEVLVPVILTDKFHIITIKPDAPKDPRLLKHCHFSSSYVQYSAGKPLHPKDSVPRLGPLQVRMIATHSSERGLTQFEVDTFISELEKKALGDGHGQEIRKKLQENVIQQLRFDQEADDSTSETKEKTTLTVPWFWLFGFGFRKNEQSPTAFIASLNLSNNQKTFTLEQIKKIKSIQHKLTPTQLAELISALKKKIIPDHQNIMAQQLEEYCLEAGLLKVGEVERVYRVALKARHDPAHPWIETSAHYGNRTLDRLAAHFVSSIHIVHGKWVGIEKAMDAIPQWSNLRKPEFLDLRVAFINKALETEFLRQAGKFHFTSMKELEEALRRFQITITNHLENGKEKKRTPRRPPVPLIPPTLLTDCTLYTYTRWFWIIPWPTTVTVTSFSCDLLAMDFVWNEQEKRFELSEAQKIKLIALKTSLTVKPHNQDKQKKIAALKKQIQASFIARISGRVSDLTQLKKSLHSLESAMDETLDSENFQRKHSTFITTLNTNIQELLSTPEGKELNLSEAENEIYQSAITSPREIKTIPITLTPHQFALTRVALDRLSRQREEFSRQFPNTNFNISFSNLYFSSPLSDKLTIELQINTILSDLPTYQHTPTTPVPITTHGEEKRAPSTGVVVPSTDTTPVATSMHSHSSPPPKPSTPDHPDERITEKGEGETGQRKKVEMMATLRTGTLLPSSVPIAVVQLTTVNTASGEEKEVKIDSQRGFRSGTSLDNDAKELSKAKDFKQTLESFERKLIDNENTISRIISLLNELDSITTLDLVFTVLESDIARSPFNIRNKDTNDPRYKIYMIAHEIVQIRKSIIQHPEQLLSLSRDLENAKTRLNKAISFLRERLNSEFDNFIVENEEEHELTTTFNALITAIQTRLDHASAPPPSMPIHNIHGERETFRPDSLLGNDSKEPLAAEEEKKEHPPTTQAEALATFEDRLEARRLRLLSQRKLINFEEKLSAIENEIRIIADTMQESEEKTNPSVLIQRLDQFSWNYAGFKRKNKSTSLAIAERKFFMTISLLMKSLNNEFEVLQEECESIEGITSRIQNMRIRLAAIEATESFYIVYSFEKALRAFEKRLAYSKTIKELVEASEEERDPEQLTDDIAKLAQIEKTEEYKNFQRVVICAKAILLFKRAILQGRTTASTGQNTSDLLAQAKKDYEQTLLPTLTKVVSKEFTTLIEKQRELIPTLNEENDSDKAKELNALITTTSARLKDFNTSPTPRVTVASLATVSLTPNVKTQPPLVVAFPVVPTPSVALAPTRTTRTTTTTSSSLSAPLATRLAPTKEAEVKIPPSRVLVDILEQGSEQDIMDFEIFCLTLVPCFERSGHPYNAATAYAAMHRGTQVLTTAKQIKDTGLRSLGALLGGASPGDVLVEAKRDTATHSELYLNRKNRFDNELWVEERADALVAFLDYLDATSEKTKYAAIIKQFKDIPRYSIDLEGSPRYVPKRAIRTHSATA